MTKNSLGSSIRDYSEPLETPVVRNTLSEPDNLSLDLAALREFFKTHDASELFGHSSPTDPELQEFLTQMTAEEIQEMLMEDFGECIGNNPTSLPSVGPCDTYESSVDPWRDWSNFHRTTPVKDYVQSSVGQCDAYGSSIDPCRDWSGFHRSNL